jgi:hypothetical protein
MAKPAAQEKLAMGIAIGKTSSGGDASLKIRIDFDHG